MDNVSENCKGYENNIALGDEIKNETVVRKVLCEERSKGREGALW